MTTSPILREEDKPVCFGCYGYPACYDWQVKTGTCEWVTRCKSSQEDY